MRPLSLRPSGSWVSGSSSPSWRGFLSKSPFPPLGTCCTEPVGSAVGRLLSPQIRAVGGLTSAVKGKKVVYTSEALALPSPELCCIPALRGRLEMLL